MLIDHSTFHRLCRARDRLRAPELEPRSIQEVARDAGISPYHFIRLFHAAFGVTPHQMRIQSRLVHAKHLLAQGELSVTQVCMDVGFSSLGSFSATFTRRVGTPPSAYRRRMRSLVQVPGHLSPLAQPGCLELMAHLPAAAFRNSGEARPGV